MGWGLVENVGMVSATENHGKIRYLGDSASSEAAGRRGIAMFLARF
jgi:hypothetical protein